MSSSCLIESSFLEKHNTAPKWCEAFLNLCVRKLKYPDCDCVRTDAVVLKELHEFQFVLVGRLPGCARAQVTGSGYGWRWFVDW